MKVKSIAECSPWSILQYFWPALAIICLENQFSVFESGRFTQVLLYMYFDAYSLLLLFICFTS